MASYEGSKNENGEYHGKGTLTYQDGSVYIGKFENGMKNGKGILKLSTGEIYDAA